MSFWVPRGTISPEKLTNKSVAQSGAYTATMFDDVIYVTGTAAITLPTALSIAGKRYTVIKTDNSGVATIGTTSGQTIGPAHGAAVGTTSVNLNTQSETWVLVSDGANWQVLAHSANTPQINFTSAWTQVNGWTSISSQSLWTWRSGKFLNFIGYFTETGPLASAASFQIGYASIGDVNIDPNIIVSATNIPVGTWGNQSQNGIYGPLFTNTNGSQKLIYFGLVTTGSVNINVFNGNALTNANGHLIRLQGAIPVDVWQQ